MSPIGIRHGLLNHPWLFSLAQRLASADYWAVRCAIRQELRLPPNRWVIDLGCGTGNLAGMFGQCRYVGVDLNLAYVRFAQRTSRRPFIVMDVTRLGFAEDVFDQVLAVGLSHHLNDEAMEHFAWQVRRVCRNAATVLIIDVIPPHWWNVPERIRQRWGERGGYVRTADEYCRLLASHLSVEKCYPLRSGFLEYSVLVLRVEKTKSHGLCNTDS